MINFKFNCHPVNGSNNALNEQKEEISYYYRYYYDIPNNLFIPQLFQCSCLKYTRISEDLGLCNCMNYYYHIICLKKQDLTCPSCNITILKPGNQENNQFEEEMVVLKKKKSKVDSKKIKDYYQSFIKQSQLKIDLQQVQQVKPQQNQKADAQEQQLKHTSNLSISQQEVFLYALNWFKFTNGSFNFIGIEKKRQEIRERFFQFLLCGLFTLENQQDTSIISALEQQLLKLDNPALEYLQNLVIELEVNLLFLLNKNQKDTLNQNYKDRVRLILLHLKDDRNLYFKRKILSKELSSNDLCVKDPVEFLSPEKQEQIQQKDRMLIEQETRTSEVLIVRTKTGTSLLQDTDQEVNKQVVEQKQVKLEEQQKQNLINSISKNEIEQQKLKEILEMTSKNQLRKMYQRLETCLPEKEASILSVGLGIDLNHG